MSTAANRRFQVLLGAWVVMAMLAGVARADDDPQKSVVPTLAEILHGTPAGPGLERARIAVSGWIDASVYTSPLTSSDVRVARVFDDDAQGFRLGQAALVVERALSDKQCYDVGGKVSVLWGTDARLLHERGLLDDQGGSEEQFDLLEAYVSARFPVAHGLALKVGKCDTPMGFEVIEAPSDILTSRSFMFGYAIPFTHTGVFAALDVDGETKVSYGLVQGWDVWDDNNGAWTQIGGWSYAPTGGRDTFSVNVIVGPEQTDNDSNLRTVLDTIWTHQWSEKWSTTLNVDYGHEAGAAAGKDATWWGVAAYATDKISDRLSGTARAEFFQDVDGTRLGSPARLGEVTVGLDWVPWRCLPNFHLRSEARWDHCFDGPFFDDGHDEDQLSLALELLFTF